MASTKFYGAQLGGKTVINYSYTDSPLRLLRWDIFYFFKFAWAWLYIVWPFTPTDSGALDELALTLPNVWAMFVHAVLFVLQLAFLLSIPFALVLPAYLTGLAMAIFFTFNWLLCMLLNGSGVEYTSDPKYTPDAEAYANEQWVFLNGVAVGEHWMKGNLNRLALTFKRPVLGIHNRTSGIIFDVIECLIQRNFGYATNDIRVCYKIVKEKLYNPQFSKVVFILHSQGGIEGGMVCDWLLQELPQDLLAKLEVYTFGCASNHFNNPHRHVNWQHQALSHPVQASADTAAPPVPSTTPKKGAGRTNGASKNDRRTSPSQAQANGTDCRTQALRLLTETSSLHPTDTSGLAIGHIEHYAHTTDFVAVWGILHFATTARSSHMLPRFKGRVFARTSPRGGHQLCQHYLDGMFPLERNPKTGEFLGAAEKGNEFMESDIVLGRDGDESADVREAYQGSWIGEALAETPDDMAAAADSTVKIHGGTPVASRSGTRRVKVKDLSRLWLYRNGRVPDEKPPLLHQEPDGVVRGATL